jgi:hypothetical protein
MLGASSSQLARKPATLVLLLMDAVKQFEGPQQSKGNPCLQVPSGYAQVPCLWFMLCLQVGKPGSSKSLALRLIHANLRGPDSPDDFFRLLPSVSAVPAAVTCCPVSAICSTTGLALAANIDTVHCNCICNMPPYCVACSTGTATLLTRPPATVLHTLATACAFAHAVAVFQLPGFRVIHI